MAACLKIGLQTPKSFIDKIEQPKSCAKKKKPKKENSLYNIEVTEVTEVEKDIKCMKIHIVGWEIDLMSGVISNRCKSTVISYHFSASKKFMFQTKNR